MLYSYTRPLARSAAEIDRTLKRVDEGLATFDDMYEQQKTAEGQVQKLKYEEDLKKEIKKLQKLREQIKTWAAGGEIKNKQPLVDARHRIEERMEAFKVVERETKTKAYSKEGLMRDQPMSAEERKRMKTREWVQEVVTQLTDSLDLIEAELEALENAENKPKLKKGEKDPAVALEAVIKSHRFHIEKLEAVSRALETLSSSLLTPLPFPPPAAHAPA
jgi:CCR4-NOT transcription complex subunit 3